MNTPLKNNYKQLADGTFGAYVNCGFGPTAIKRPGVGDAITVTTAKGQRQTRIIDNIETEFASGMVVRLVEISRPELSRAELARRWDNTYNEGHRGGGYNPYAEQDDE